MVARPGTLRWSRRRSSSSNSTVADSHSWNNYLRTFLLGQIKQALVPVGSAISANDASSVPGTVKSTVPGISIFEFSLVASTAHWTSSFARTLA